MFDFYVSLPGSHMPFCRAVSLFLVVFVASACSSMHGYANNKPENLTLKPDIRSGFAQLHVYDIDNACNAIYRGTVKLTNVKMMVGIPVNSLSYLEFSFSDSSVFSGSHSTSSGVYLIPRAGYQYDAVISYIDKMYSSTIYEQDIDGGARSEIQKIVPKACVSK